MTTPPPPDSHTVLDHLAGQTAQLLTEFQQSNRLLEKRAARAERDLIAYHSTLTEAIRRIRSGWYEEAISRDTAVKNTEDLMKVMDDPDNAPRDWEERGSAVQVPTGSLDQPVQRLRGDD